MVDQSLSVSDFKALSTDKLRYADTDTQGHINNAVFSTLLETGRVELLFSPDSPLTRSNAQCVIARLELDFIAELTWPGEVTIATRVERIGGSSVTLLQALFQDNRCAASAKTIIVHFDPSSRRSAPWHDEAQEFLRKYQSGYAD